MKRNNAFALISAYIEHLTEGALTAYELPDSAILCNALDDMQGMTTSEARDFAREAAEEMLSDEGFIVGGSEA